MKLRIFILIIGLVFQCISYANDKDELFKIISSNNPNETDDDIKDSITAGIWSSNKELFIGSFLKEDFVFVFAIIKNKTDYIFVDVSRIGNVKSEFSWAGTIDSGRIEVIPISIEEHKDHFYTKIRKRVWIKGQQFTKVRPLVICRDGSVQYQ